MKYGVLKYPGGHGDAELVHVLKYYFSRDTREVWFREEAFPEINALFIGGGFPCGKSELTAECYDDAPAITYLQQFTDQGGLVIGIGNGFRLLCEVGLLPGKLEQNSTERYICRQVFIKAENHLTAITAGLSPDQIYRNPIATDYGRYSASDEDLVEMRREGQILFRYCDPNGRITQSVNYTGSKENIAGICNRNKNVFGLVPQPERAVSELGAEGDGALLMRALLEKLDQ